MSYIQSVGFSWRHASRTQPAIDRLDVRIERGERVLLVGPSGSGKSTLLAALAGVLDHAERGEASGLLTIAGDAPAARRHPVGLLRQDPETSVVLGRVGDEVRFGCENLGVPVDETNRRARDALETVGLRVDENHSTASLSGGQKQRLALAALLAMQPELWLLDEPTAQLDPVGAVAVREALSRALRPDDTVLVVEHHAAEWWSVISRVIALNAHGQLVVDATPEQAVTEHRATLEALGVWLPNTQMPSLALQANERHMLLAPENLGVGRGMGRGAAVATFDQPIASGDALVLRGANGSGKSTIALTLGGLLRPLSGSVHANRDWAPRSRRGVSISAPDRWNSQQLAARIASVFQQPDLQFVRHTVRDELHLGARSAEAADALLDELGLAALAAAHPRSLSGGEKRRLSVATALASRAELIIADEPTFGQDANSWLALTAQLAAARDAGRALVLPSHDERLAPRLSAAELMVTGLTTAGGLA